MAGEAWHTFCMQQWIRPTREEFNRLCLEVTDRMREHTFPFVASISKEIEPDFGKHLGSGLYLAMGDDTYLLTNEHVARSINEKPLAHQLLNGDHATRISNPFQVVTQPYDIAVTRIERNLWSQPRNIRRALPAHRLAAKHDPVDMELLFLLGYSGERSYFSATFETLFTRGTPLLTQEAKDPPEGLSEMYFALPYRPDLSTSMDSRSAGLPRAEGFSGSPVWDTGFLRCMHENRRWTPEESRITGILPFWNKKTAHLVAIRIEHVREFLLYAHRNEAAYFRWIERGRPSNDALSDWLHAENSIPSI